MKPHHIGWTINADIQYSNNKINMNSGLCSLLVICELNEESSQKF